MGSESRGHLDGSASPSPQVRWIRIGRGTPRGPTVCRRTASTAGHERRATGHPRGACVGWVKSAHTAAVRTFDELLHTALVRLCGDRTELLAHAVRASAPREPLRPLGSLCGPAAIDHADLAGALYRLRPAGTGLTHAALRRRHPVWIPALDAESALVTG